MRLVSIDYCAHLRENGKLLAEAAGRDLDAHVPSCPDWNVAKLVIHMGQHHRWVADSVRRGGGPPVDQPKPGLRGDELIAWLRQGVGDLADLLERSEDEAPAWSWSGDNRVGFWRRRTALETLVHRWDGENATGETSPLDPVLASDCVDEMLFIFAPRYGSAYAGQPGTTSLSLTDTPGAWAIGFTSGEVPTTERGGDGPPPSDVTIEGRAEDVSLFLWGRRGPDVVKVNGDEDLARPMLDWMGS
jgi:uncharacterized Actinobacterial protein TIGR03083